MGNMGDAFRSAGFNGPNNDKRQQQNNNNRNQYVQNNNYASGSVNNRPRGLDGSTDYDPIEEGKKLVEKMKEEYLMDERKFRFTTSQLRKILAITAIVKNKVDMEAREGKTDDNKISSEMQHEVQYIRLKLVYQMGRENAVKTWLGEKGINMPEIIKDIGDDRKKFDDFYRLLESIVAYKKFLIPKNEGR